ncbi:MAG TPA: dTDP-4-dehydrorhamnose 3,5-epimerase [Saprospiraceae bacterium]|nr:dTDP-4-dehydrorhamnose 3,5-epimerase [Saprospiraceae bacterium]
MFEQTEIPGLIIFTPRIFGDKRGYFFESYNQNLFKQAGIHNEFVQDNQSKSSFGVLRGLHYQRPPFAQAKLVRVTQGKVLDVAVDIRENSPTFGQHHSIILSDENNKQFLIPRGFAHGFLVLSETAIFQYKCDNFYSAEHDAGIRFDDPRLNIDWGLKKEELLVSEKDSNLPFLGDHIKFIDNTKK